MLHTLLVLLYQKKKAMIDIHP